MVVFDSVYAHWCPSVATNGDMVVMTAARRRDADFMLGKLRLEGVNWLLARRFGNGDLKETRLIRLLNPW